MLTILPIYLYMKSLSDDDCFLFSYDDQQPVFINALKDAHVIFQVRRRD